MIVYRDSKAQLDTLRRLHPELFAQRRLYLQVQALLESYAFKLPVRREVLGLFSEAARLREQLPSLQEANHSSSPSYATSSSAAASAT